jgi:hypothetical protein
MVTGEYLRQKLVEPLKEKQRAEGRAEGLAEGREKGREAERAAWDAWYRRRIDAERGLGGVESPSHGCRIQRGALR